MKLVPLRQAESALLSAIKVGRPVTVVVATKKKDRSLTVTVEESGLISYTEAGFEHTTETGIDQADARHAIKHVFVREFPRSHMAYLEERR